ncbi:MAG: hypothetical protein SPK49_06750 [Erysipelotrichaceae bacterium]|nr:hypothetical protein [Erysipelotrichaceae bacterium]
MSFDRVLCVPSFHILSKNLFTLIMPIGNTIYLFSRKTIGNENELGAKLIRGFLNNLSKQEVLPKLLFFLNEGTFLAYTDDETLLTPLRTLADKGVDIAICKTCLDFYNLDAEKMPVGRVGTSPEFVKLTTEFPVMTVT